MCRAAEFAKRAIDRHDVGSLLWEGLIWRDESQLVARRATRLDDGAAQLVADVALLLNLTCSCDDQHARFGDMSELPHCLSRSRDRSEVLGAGCPGACGWNLCPYTVPRPDSPRTHRNLSRAFCRQQQQIVQRRRRRLPWHRGLRRGALEAFWWEMERRARN